MRLGVDLGGTKTEVIALDQGGGEVLRSRIPTPRGDYDGIVSAIRDLVRDAEAELAARGHEGPHTVGIGMPGTISPFSGLAINANSTELNDRPFQRDLEAALDRPLRFANDANCLAVSEAVDGAGAGAHLVFAAILGTGCGAGIAIDGVAHEGRHRIGGEWGHNPLPGVSVQELAEAQTCWCGRFSCLETWISGTGFARDHGARTGERLTGEAIVARALEGEPGAQASVGRYLDRLARALAQIVNILDPDVIVLGGGMSNVAGLYERLPALMAPRVFADRFTTPVYPARHGDSSGVRGAAWLWGR